MRGTDDEVGDTFSKERSENNENGREEERNILLPIFEERQVIIRAFGVHGKKMVKDCQSNHDSQLQAHIYRCFFNCEEFGDRFSEESSKLDEEIKEEQREVFPMPCAEEILVLPRPFGV
jgi:hypothetical protein